MKESRDLAGTGQCQVSFIVYLVTTKAKKIFFKLPNNLFMTLPFHLLGLQETQSSIKVSLHSDYPMVPNTMSHSYAQFHTSMIRFLQLL